MDLDFEQFDDEIDVVLAALRLLASKVSRPVVRECLEEAHDDIAFLAHEEDCDAPGDSWLTDAA
jgi:hypothetical protein